MHLDYNISFGRFSEFWIEIVIDQDQDPSLTIFCASKWHIIVQACCSFPEIQIQHKNQIKILGFSCCCRQAGWYSQINLVASELNIVRMILGGSVTNMSILYAWLGHIATAGVTAEQDLCNQFDLQYHHHCTQSSPHFPLLFLQRSLRLLLIMFSLLIIPSLSPDRNCTAVYLWCEITSNFRHFEI